jgi:RNA recognition motif-containing protein
VVEGVEVLGSGPDRNMALVRFKNIEDCFYAIAEMHNRAVLGRKLQLSFTKSRVI